MAINNKSSVKIKVPNVKQALKVLKSRNIECYYKGSFILVNEADEQIANHLLPSEIFREVIKEHKIAKKPKERKERNKPGPKTKASKGETLYTKYSITLSPEVDNYLLIHQRKNERISQAINRLIMELMSLKNESD